jgi:alpha-L-arabinofuranosidase
VDAANTTIWAQFKGVDPNEAEVEINVRRPSSTPTSRGVNFITVRGFTMMHAATPWAPPTAEQIGLIGTHWSKGWIIENNDISYSTCTGITLGKHGDEFDNTSQDTAEGYVKTIERGLAQRLVQRKHRPPHRPQQPHLALRAGGHRRQPGRGVQHRHRQRHPRHPHPPACSPAPRWRASSSTPPSTPRSQQPHLPHVPRHLARLDGPGHARPENLLHDNPSEDLFVEVNHGPFHNLMSTTTSSCDASPLKLDTDYFGAARKADNPFPGPFEISQSGKQSLTVWPNAK